MELLLMGLMGCMAIDVLLILQKGRVKVDSLEISGDGDRNPEPPRYFKRIRLTFLLSGVPAEARPRVDRAIELSSEKYCSVLHSLRQDLELETVVEGV
jgi:putative redox protein